jgi:hypothetical protein
MGYGGTILIPRSPHGDLKELCEENIMQKTDLALPYSNSCSVHWLEGRVINKTSKYDGGELRSDASFEAFTAVIFQVEIF